MVVPAGVMKVAARQGGDRDGSTGKDLDGHRQSIRIERGVFMMTYRAILVAITIPNVECLGIASSEVGPRLKTG